MTQQYKYNPEDWLASSVRALKEYAEDAFLNSVLDNDTVPSGDQFYRVIMEFPSDDLTLTTVPLDKTLIHFEIDDIGPQVLGFGENIGKEFYDTDRGVVIRQEAAINTLNFDVGIWASNENGGPTARLRAYQVLQQIFVGSLATESLFTATDAGDGGLELISFTGGRFVRDTLNDIPVFRMVNCTLVIRVFSRTPKPQELPPIEDIVQNPELVIHPNLTIP